MRNPIEESWFVRAMVKATALHLFMVSPINACAATSACAPES
jgi:hypothetical protein